MVTPYVVIRRYIIAGVVLSQVNYRRYTFEAPFGALAENLVNSLDHSIAVPEHLATPADLSEFLQEHAFDWPRRVTHADLEAVREVRAEIRALFDAPSLAQATDRLNELLAGAHVNLQLRRDKGTARIDWTLDPSVSLAEALRAAAAVSAAHLVTQLGFDRFRVCGADPCADVFLDTSKRGEQRFCGPRCATRVRVAAHRARQ
jgi:predicted RNA-binding Zn ribbon-like protein